jgi:hypothetical protein
MRKGLSIIATAFVAVLTVFVTSPASATPANKAALEKHFDRFLAKDLQSCSVCHLPATTKNPEELEQIPHNPFGERLMKVGREMVRAGLGKKMQDRLQRVSAEDSDQDGIANQIELLLGSNPGDPQSRPSNELLRSGKTIDQEFGKFLASYRWEPFTPVKPPSPPALAAKKGNSIDSFISEKQRELGLKPRPQASKEVLLRRLYLDLIGLSPTPEEQDAFLQDQRPDVYERLVERLLNDPRHGERWARHWMDVWRYSDWAGWSGGDQIRDSQPHIWRWRDWIVESLNQDRPYSEMLVEMIACHRLPCSEL